MRASVTERAKVISKLEVFFSDVKSLENKDWVRRVPAAAVILAVQIAAIFIGSKTSVACLVSSL